MGGLTRCNGECIDTDSNPNACGDCNTACMDSEVCDSGSCVCRPGLTLCGGQCIDLDSDPNNCGSCNNVCSVGQACENGSCQAALCSQDTCTIGVRRACVDLSTDPLHCGNCMTRCQRDEVCVDSVCVNYAPAAPCNTCPCDAICADQVGTPNVCCDGLTSSSGPICVEQDTCPN